MENHTALQAMVGGVNSTSLPLVHQGEEHGELEIEVVTVLFLVLAVLSFLIIVANSFAIAVIAVSPSLRNATGYLMISLAVSDLGVGVTAAVPLIYSAFTRNFSRVACDVMGFINSVTWVVSVMMLTLLSVDRYIAIAHPFRYSHLVTPSRCALAISVTWLYSIGLWLLPLVGIGAYKFNDEELTCYFNVGAYPTQWLIYNVLIFCPTSALIMYCNINIWKVARNQKRRIAAAAGTVDSTMVAQTSSNFKAARTLSIVVGAFYVAWLPFIVEHVVKAIQGSLETVPEWAEIFIYVLALANSFWNPFIYIGTNRVFRHTTAKLLCCAK